MDLDITIIVQFSVLVILLVSLERLLFKPLLALLDARREKTVGTRAEGARLESLAHKDAQAYAEQLKEARKQVQRDREEARRVAREKERALLLEQREKAASVVVAGRGAVMEAEAGARMKLASESQVLAREIVQRLLGRGVG
jgi:F-type H+-transporting ATPase subunit b